MILPNQDIIDFKEEMWICKTKKEDTKKTLI